MSKTQAPVVNVNEVSRISTGTVLKGEINSPVDLRIDGFIFMKSHEHKNRNNLDNCYRSWQ